MCVDFLFLWELGNSRPITRGRKKKQTGRSETKCEVCSVVAAICVAMAAQAQLVLGSSIALPLLLDEHHHCSSAASLRLGGTQGLRRYSLSCQSSTKEKKRSGNGLQRRERKGTVCMALGDNNPSPAQPQVYQGIYGPWSVDSLDIREVGSVRNSVFGQRVHDSCAFLTIQLNCCESERVWLEGISHFNSVIVRGCFYLGYICPLPEVNFCHRVETMHIIRDLCKQIVGPYDIF